MLADIASDPLASRSTDTGADFLDSEHQREGEHHRPGDREAKLCAGLTVCADTGGIETDGTLLRGWLSGLPAAAFWERRRLSRRPQAFEPPPHRRILSSEFMRGRRNDEATRRFSRLLRR